MLSEMVQVSIIKHACAGPGVGGWDSQLLAHHLQECGHALRNGSGQYYQACMCRAWGGGMGQVGGIPSFWPTIFKNVDMLSEMVQVSS
jgi:hypothetical protein